MNRIECPYEQLLREAGYIQVYDGQAAPQRPGDPTSLKPDERKFFIRYYQQIKNNHLANEYVKLVYDLRTGHLARWPEHYRKAANGRKQTKDMLNLRA